MALQRNLKRIGTLFLIFSILGFVLFYLVQHYLSHERLRSQLIDILQKTTHRRVTVSHWSPWSAKGLFISQLVIHDQAPFDGTPLFRAESIKVEHDLFSFFRKGKRVFQVRFIRPELYIKKKAGRLNIEDLGVHKGGLGPFFSLPILFARIVYEGGRITYEEDGKKWTLEDIFIDLSGVKGKGHYDIDFRTPGIKGNAMKVQARIQALPGSIQGEGTFLFARIPSAQFGSFLPGYLGPFMQKATREFEGRFHFITSVQRGVSSFDLPTFKARLNKGTLFGKIQMRRGEMNRIDLDLSFINIGLFPIMNLQTKGWILIKPLQEGRHQALAEFQIIDFDSLPLDRESIRWEDVVGKASFNLFIAQDKGAFEIEDLSIRLANGLAVKGKGSLASPIAKEDGPFVGRGWLKVEAADLQALSESLKGLPFDIDGRADVSFKFHQGSPSTLMIDGLLGFHAIELHSKGSPFSIRGLEARMPILDHIPLKGELPKGSLDTRAQAPWGWFRVSDVDHDLLRLQDLKGPIRMANRNIEAKDLTYTLFKGKGKGSATIHLGPKAISANLDTRLTGSDLEEFARQNRLDRVKLSGLVSGRLRLKAPSLKNPNIQALFEVLEPGGSLNLAFLERIAKGKSLKHSKSSSQDLARFKFRRAKAALSTKDERLMLDLTFHKVKLGLLFGLRVNKMEFRDIPIEMLGKAIRGKG